jgi:lysophospholipase L1-like esterase
VPIIDVSNSSLDNPFAKPLRTLLAFGCLAVAAHAISAPWWEGAILSIRPELPDPSGAFVDPPEADEEVKEKLATVDLAPTEGSDDSDETSSPDEGADGARPDHEKASGPSAKDRDASRKRAVSTPPDSEPDRSPLVFGEPTTTEDLDLLETVRTLDRQLDQPPTPLERPCLEYVPDYLTRSYEPVCERRAMDPFFAKLRDVALERTDEPVRFSQFGDSLIAGDSFTGELRRLLQKQFGAGGYGFVHVGEASKFSETRHLDTDTSAAWTTYDIVHDPRAGAPFGLAGVAFEATGRPTLEITPQESGRGRNFDRVGLLYYRRRRSLAIRVNIGGDGRDVDLSGSPESNAIRWLEADPGAQQINVAGFNRSAYFYGLILEQSGPGVVIDNLGLSSGRAPRLRFIDADQWRTQIRKRGSDAVSFAYGVNSVGVHKASDQWLSDYTDDYVSVLETARGASDEVGCMTIGLLMRGGLENGRVVVRDSVPPMIRHQRRAARHAQCAFWDAHAAMGGQEGAQRWYENRPQLLSSDLAHPTRAGYKKLANLFYASLIREFRYYLDERIQRATIPRLRSPHASDDALLSRDSTSSSGATDD